MPPFESIKAEAKAKIDTYSSKIIGDVGWSHKFY